MSMLNTRLMLALVALLLCSSASAATEDLVFQSGFDTSAPPVVPAGAMNFSNVTSQSLDQIQGSSYRFDAMWTDFNGDGCYDAWIFDHESPGTSRLWINRCDGSNTFTLEDNAAVNYFIPNPDMPRGSGWVTLIDFNGDGRQDFWTWDYTNLAARYVNGTASATSGAPFFSGKQAACNEHCVVADINGDGRLDIVHENRAIEDALNGTSIAPAAGQSGYRNAAYLNGDGWVDLLQPGAGGYWKNNAGNLSWVSVPGLVGTTNLMA
ncbi:MAG: VCBS repeat-containing protein, partial [Rhodanobacteraceae bacterium]